MSDHDAPVEEDAPVEDASAEVPPLGPEEGEAGPDPGPADPPRPEDEPVHSAIRERDEYLDALRRLQAEFENYKKRMLRQQTETLERAGATLVEKLLPVLDAIDLARSHGTSSDLEQVAGALLDVLTKEGLERIDPVGQPFDPNEQEAVQHEPGEGDDPVVSSLFRAGWRWRGRVLRPAAVAVKG